MEYNCEYNSMSSIRHPYGNPLRIAIEMTLRTMSGEGDNISSQDEPFVPGGPVRVVLQSGAKQYTYDASVEGNVATILDNSKLPIGTYSVEMFTVDKAGTQFRCKYRNVVTVVDYNCEAGITQPIEFQVETQHLDALFSSAGYSGKESDPTIPDYVKGITQQDIDRWNAKQDAVADLAAIRAKLNTAVQDPNYQHTDNNFTDAEKEKLAGLENFDPSGLVELDDNTSRVKYGQSSTVVLDVIELPGGDDDDEGEAISMEPGMVYGKSNGHLIYVKNDEVGPVEYDLGVSTGLVFFNKADNKFYRYNGTRWVQAGNSGDGGTFEQAQADWEETDTSDPSYIKNKPTVPTELSQLPGDSTHRTVTDAEKTAWNNKQDALTFDESPTEDSTNPVESGGVYAALEGKAPKPLNTVYVDLAYWNSHKSSGTVFSADDTHYILAHDFYNVVEPLSGSSAVPVQVFGKRCVLSAQNGCRFGRVKIQFTDTYIAVGQQQIFKQIEYEHPSSYDTTSSFIVEDGTRIAGTFANGRILVEWWGAIGGRGVKGEDGTFENAATERQALHNAIAFNLALMCAGQSEVYAPAPMYMIGASIMDATIPMLRDDIAHNSDGQFDPDIFDNDKINSTITSYTKLYVEGDLVASNEFVGAKRRCTSDDTINGIEGVPITAETEIPAVVYIGGCLPRCFIKGAIVVPYSAQDKTIVVLSSNEALPANPVVGETYFKPVTDEVKVDENTKVNVSFYDVYDAYYHYTDDDSPEKEVALRKVGHYYTTSSNLTNYKSSGSAYGGSNLKMPGMYGASVSAIGGYVEIARIIKGDHRGGFWNTTQDGKLMSYRYRKEVMHMGQCTALGLRCVKASTIKAGLIEGFNDGVAFDGTHSPDYDAVEFNRFEFGSIACNHAIHSINGNTGHACLVNMTKDTKYFLDGSRWLLGGFEPFGAGSDGRHSFCPTTSKSTYLLVEWSGTEHGGGFSNHWFEWNNAPLRWYTSIIDIAHAKDNQFIMHGNTSGDTGRIVMWVRSSNISSDNSKFQYADGEDASSAWFPIDTFAGVESISLRPYAYADLAAMDNPSNTWSTRNSYTYKKQQVGRLAPASPSYTEWACPFSASRSFINFRTGSYNNVVRGGRDHMLCYNSVLNDSKSGRNELRHCQSAQAMYVDGNYTVYNANHPVFDIVRYERQADPRDHHNDQNHLAEGGEGRIMFVPDENTLSCLQAVDAVADISASGLYIIKGLSEVSTSAGNYKNTRYQLFEKYGNASAVALGWISSIFLKLVEGGGSGSTITETDPTVPAYVKAITQANIAAWNAKAERVVLNMTVSNDVPSFTTLGGVTFTEAEFRALAADNSKEIVILRNGTDYYINTYRDSEIMLVFVGHTSGRLFNVFYIGLDDEELYHEEHDIDVPFYLSELSQDSTHRTVTDTEKSAWNAKVNSSDLAEVATSGDYDDLINKPTIPTVPTNVSSFTNDAGYLTSHQDISGKADKVTVVEVSDAGAVSQALDPNKFYKFTGALTSLSLTLVSGTGFVMYAGKFTTGSGWGSNGLTIPATVTEAANNDEIAASKTYEFSIMDNVIVIKEV